MKQHNFYLYRAHGSNSFQYAHFNVDDIMGHVQVKSIRAGEVVRTGIDKANQHVSALRAQYRALQKQGFTPITKVKLTEQINLTKYA